VEEQRKQKKDKVKETYRKRMENRGIAKCMYSMYNFHTAEADIDWWTLNERR